MTVVQPRTKLELIFLKGESFDNPDGTSRQNEIARCSVGEKVSFARDKTNPKDKNAVLVLSPRNIGIGYFPSDLSYHYAALIDSGVHMAGIINNIMGGTPGKPNYGVAIRIRTGGKTPDRPIVPDTWVPDENHREKVEARAKFLQNQPRNKKTGSLGAMLSSLLASFRHRR